MNKEHPIIFSTKMVRAILDGRKTQTRRPVNPQAWSYNTDLLQSHILYPRENKNESGDPSRPILSPYGYAGDRLWVRETFAFIDNTPYGGSSYYEYKVDKPNAKYPGNWPADMDPQDVPCRWKPSIFMPRTASRIILEVTSIKVKRLQEISDEDCIVEGVADRESFKKLWNSIHKVKHTWKDNPWVWVISFKRVQYPLLGGDEGVGK